MKYCACEEPVGGYAYGLPNNTCARCGGQIPK